MLIVGNTVVLALDYHGIDPDMLSKLELANLVFFGLFFVEMIIKLLGLGFKEYFRDKYNTFDFAIILFSCLDVVFLFLPGVTSVLGGAVTAMRGFRLLRIFKLARQWGKF